MYDMAKRSLAFTVATGGLLLTGTGYAPADAAVGFGTFPGPAQAQGSAAATQASPTSVSTPISVRASESALPPAVIAPAPLRDVRVLTPTQPRAGGPGAGAAASSTVKNSGGILTGNTVEIPIDLGLNLCTNQANGVAASNTVAGSTCGGSNAAGGSNSGASATSVTDHSGGILSGNIIQAPVNVPLNACGNQVNVVGAKGTAGGTDCSTGTGGSGTGGSNATAVTNHSGGIGSGMAIQAPINVPVNVCGNQVTAGGLSNNTGGAVCTNSGGSSSALAATMNSGGIASGNSGQLPINVPVEACGNQAGAVSVKDTVGGTSCSGSTPPNATETSVVTNSGGILAGNQPSVPINVPVNVCGVQGSVGVGSTTGGVACNTPPPHSCPMCSPSPSPSTSTSMSASPSTSASTSASPSGSPSPRSSGSGSPSPSTSTSTSASSSPSPRTCPACTTATPTTTGSVPPTGPVTPPSGPGMHPGPGSLAHTGGEEGIALAIGAGALLAGVGARVASRRRSQR